MFYVFHFNSFPSSQTNPLKMTKNSFRNSKLSANTIKIINLSHLIAVFPSRISSIKLNRLQVKCKKKKQKKTNPKPIMNNGHLFLFYPLAIYRVNRLEQPKNTHNQAINFIRVQCVKEFYEFFFCSSLPDIFPIHYSVHWFRSNCSSLVVFFFFFFFG